MDAQLLHNAAYRAAMGTNLDPEPWLTRVHSLISQYPEHLRAALIEEFAHYVRPEHLQDINLEGAQEPTFMLLNKTQDNEYKISNLQPPEITLPDLKELHNYKLKCKACRSEDVMQVCRQTRSGDEPASWEYQCKNCFHAWRRG